MANDSTKALLSYLKGLTGKGCVSGQFAERGDLAAINAIATSTGKNVGMVGFDPWYFNQQGPASQSWVASAKQVWAAGSMVTLSCAMPNPQGGGIVGGSCDFDALIKPGTAQNNAFNGLLDGIAAGIAAFGKPLLFRPFHENNGPWVWYGPQSSTDAQFTAAWKYTHDYLEKTKGLQNILWVNAQNAGGPKPSRFATGYTDIAGLDGYTSNPAALAGDFATLAQTGLPLALTEYGSGDPSGGDTNFDMAVLTAALKGPLAKAVYWLQWWDGNSGGKPGWGMASVKNVQAALSDRWIKNRGDFALDAIVSPTPTPTPTVTDPGGHVWTLVTGNVMRDGVAVAGGGGTSALTLVAGVIYAQDGGTGNWWSNIAGHWGGPLTVLPGPPVVTPPTITHLTVQAQIDQAMAILTAARAALAALTP